MWAAGFWATDFWADGFWAFGDAPTPPPQETQSGGGFWFDFEYEMARRRKRQREEDEEREAEERLQDEIDRNIAILLHEQERKDQERKALERLRGLVSKYATEKTSNERLDRALSLAQQRQTLASYEALEREFRRAQEDEEFMFLLAVLAEDLTDL